jgi:hypothetical protein
MLQYITNMIGQDGGSAPSGGQRCLRLFTNNITPGDTTAINDLTEATTPTGYQPITLAGASWTTVITNGSGLAVYSQQIFTFTTGVTLYGYYVTTIGVSPQLLWVEVFTNTPWTLPDGGGQVGVTPQFAMNNP